ncbi:Structural maintenance of chromosomes protein 4 [Venturia nashicola]|uniref:Structural maintenance of chromosomes protein 4 n=1 Tax=Venturia nashicola TaxID=86259 RepID=A0A4Z1P2T2_9PEZI|nr:Structural maintenance of chromosomes protein 4 [Venturia nashicola]TLD19518.1 Structural maintenance of chromosomes protein 4 [Venturia nashicola]
MALRAFLLSSLAASTLALPSYSNSYQSAVEHQNRYGRRDGPGGHGGDSMAGMGHGGGEKKPAGGMGGGGMGGGKSGDSLSEKMASSPLTQPLLDSLKDMMPVMNSIKRQLDQPSSSKQRGAKLGSIFFGPFELVTAKERLQKPNSSPMAMDPGATSFMNKIDFPKDITLIDIKLYPVYEDGSPANTSNGVYNHHVAFSDTSKRPTAIAACPGQSAKSGIPLSVFAGTGEDSTSFNYAPDLPDFEGGYYIGPNHGTSVAAELINKTNDPKKVYVKAVFNYVQGKKQYDVSGATLSVTQCDAQNSQLIRPPKGQKIFAVTSKDMTLTKDGYIFDLKGHLHDGGDYVGISINGKEICQSKGIYQGAKTDAQGERTPGQTLTDMSVCNTLTPVKKGDKLSIVAKYDLENHPPREQTGGSEAEEMGLAMFSFAASAPAGADEPTGWMTVLTEMWNDYKNGPAAAPASPPAKSVAL